MTLSPYLVLWPFIALAFVQAGCAKFNLQETEITGTVQVQGLAGGQLAGSRVELQGWGVSSTNSLGYYRIAGYINGADPYVLIVSRPGYQSQTLTGTFPYDESATEHKKQTVTIPTVTLRP